LTHIINNLDTISPLIVLLYAVLFRTIKGEYRIVFLYLLLQLVLNLCTTLIDIFIPSYNNIWLYQINSFLSFVVLSIFFQKINPYARNAYAKSVNILFVLLLFIIILFEKRDAFNSISYSIVSILVTFFCLNYYWFLIKETPTTSLIKNEFFFFATGFFIYYTANIFVFATYRIFTIDHIQTNTFWLLWKFHNFMFTVMCIFMIKGFSCILLPKTPSS